MPTYIERAYISITSDETPPDELTARLGVEPTSTRDSLKNPRPNGMKSAHPFSWHLESDSPSDWVGDHIEALRPAFEKLALKEPLPTESRTFVVYGFARGMGYWFGFDPEQSALLSAAACGVGMDVYQPAREHDVPDSTPETKEQLLSKVPRATTPGGLVIREPLPTEYSDVVVLVAKARGFAIQPRTWPIAPLWDQIRNPWVCFLVAENSEGALVGIAHVSLSQDILESATRAHVNLLAASDANDEDCIRGLLGECVTWAERAGATELTVPSERLNSLPAGPVVKTDLVLSTVSFRLPDPPPSFVRLG